MTETHEEGTSKQDCGINATYGLFVAIVGLLISLLIAAVMIWFGIRTASDLVAVIAAFTGITGTLTGYFFGEKAGSAGRENTENKLSASVNALISEKTNSATIDEKLQIAKSNNKMLYCYVKTDQDVITDVTDNKLNRKDIRMWSEGNEKVPPENVIYEVLDSLNKAKIPKDVLDSLKIKDD